MNCHGHYWCCFHYFKKLWILCCLHKYESWFHFMLFGKVEGRSLLCLIRFNLLLFCGKLSSVQFSRSSCRTLCDPMNCRTPGLPFHHQIPEFTQTHVHRVGDAIQPSHPLSSPSPPAPNPSQHQSLLQWVNSSHEVAKVLEFELQHQSFQRTPRTDLL